MEKNIVLIHAASAVAFVIYLLVRSLIFLFGFRDREYLGKVRLRLRKPDWFFAGLLFLSGLYPIIALGRVELYHLIKLAVLVIFIYWSRYATKFNLAASNLALIVLTIAAGISSFVDQPSFPKVQGTFETLNPEISAMSGLEKGKYIFDQLCVQCHGFDGKRGKFGAADLTLSKLDLTEKQEIIAGGSPLTVMRAFSSELSADEIQAVAIYVSTLSSD